MTSPIMPDQREGTVLPDRCPLCGGPNGCGIAAGQASCWCFAARIPQAVLDRVPAAARDAACICQRCAASSVPSPAAAPAGRTDP